MAADRATTSNIRLLDPNIVSPAFTQFQQGKNFYYFPDQLTIDRYSGRDGNLRDYVVAARELNPDRLIDNQRDWINRHTVYTHGNGFIASPANTVRGIANDPNQNGGYPEFLASVVGANGSVVSPGSGAAGSAAHLLRPGHRQRRGRLRDRRQERRPTASTTTRPTPRPRTTPTPAAAVCRSATGWRAACSPPSSPSGTSCSPT